MAKLEMVRQRITEIEVRIKYHLNILPDRRFLKGDITLLLT